MLFFESLNSFISMITFQIKRNQEIGCEFYLLSSSAISLLVMIFITLKYLFLLLSQIAIITNRAFLGINCILIDFLLQSLLVVNDWLNVSIAIERTATTIRVTFDENKSRSATRVVVILLVLIAFGSHVHYPIHR